MSGPYHPTGRARVSARYPSALAVCQRCGFTYQRTQLRNQVQWQGMLLQPLNLYVCPPCFDVPQIQLKTIIIPPDPVPVYLPFPEPYSVEVPSFIATESAIFAGDDITTEAGDPLIAEIEITPTPNQNNPVIYPP